MTGVGKVYLVGESNPYGSDPRYALYPEPAGASGARLAAILGMGSREYLDTFERRNVLSGPWDIKTARLCASVLHAEAAGLPMVLLGRRVAAAFGLPKQPYFEEATADSSLLVLPHPSGLCRLWNAEGVAERARELVWRLVARAAKMRPSDGGRGCPECSYEQLHGRVGEYEQHECELEGRVHEVRETPTKRALVAALRSGT